MNRIHIHISSLSYYIYAYTVPTEKRHRIGTPKGKIESDSNCCTDFSYSMWFYVLRMMSLHKFCDFIPCEPAYHSSFQPAPLYMVSKLLTVPTILSQLLGFRVSGWSEMAIWLKLCDWNFRDGASKGEGLFSNLWKHARFGIIHVLILLGGQINYGTTGFILSFDIIHFGFLGVNHFVFGLDPC